jgi:uncharacterized membrane protein
MDWEKLIDRLKNPGTVVTLVGLIVLILTQNGVAVDDVRIMTTVKAICGILIVLGIMNNPDTPGLDIPGLPKDKEDK